MCVSHELVRFLKKNNNNNNLLSVCVPSGLLETGPQEGVVVAGVGVVEEDGAWAEETALTPAGNETLTDTAAVTNRESVLSSWHLNRPVNAQMEMTDLVFVSWRGASWSSSLSCPLCLFVYTLYQGLLLVSEFLFIVGSKYFNINLCFSLFTPAIRKPKRSAVAVAQTTGAMWRMKWGEFSRADC